MNKKAIWVIVVIALVSIGIWQVFLKKEKSTLNVAEVIKGNITQEFSETGQVKKGEEINLSFKNSGVIENIYVEVGEAVKAGDLLVKLKTNELEIQLQEAKASLSLVQAQLDKLLAGASQEEVKILQTNVENSQIALDTANQNLKDSYENALNTLNDVYLKAYNAQNTVDLIQRTYFTNNDQEGIKVRENQGRIANSVSKIKTSLDVARTTSSQENIDLALSQSETELTIISNGLKIIREACEEPTYRYLISSYQYLISSTDKTSLDTQRTNINTALSNVISSRQTITAKKLATIAAEGQLKTAQNELSLKIAPARKEDVNLYQAQVDKALAKVRLLENQIQEMRLRSPVAGEIAEIKKEVGELVQPASQDVVIIILPSSPFKIETNIYEEDVVNMAVGNPVEISLVALPQQNFAGRVVSIDPAEKLIEGVVYYKVIVIFDTATSSASTPEGIKSGMTADLVIKTASRENVLVIPGSALQKKDGKTIVQVLKDKITEERQVEIGLEGADNNVEIISGLEVGEKVIIP